MSRLLKVVLICFLLSSYAQAATQVGVKAGTWTFSRNGQSTSGVGAYSLEVNQPIRPSISLSVGISFLYENGFSGSSGYGFDFGARYFPWTFASHHQAGSEDSSVAYSEKFRPYAGLFLRQRLFGLSQSVSYLGPGVSAGLDYSLYDSFLLNAEARYDQLQGSDSTATQINLLFGCTWEF